MISESAGRWAGIWLIVRRSLRQHALSTAVTVFSGALACGLVMAVFNIQFQARKAFTGGAVGFDAVLGARGSKLQLVLNTVFHLETSPGNIPWAMYQAIKKDPMVSLAVPYAVGDNYFGYRIVGTTPELFEKGEGRRGQGFQIEPGGRMFDPKMREAVIGQFAAKKTNLRVGSRFNPYHGVVYDQSMRHAEEYTVTGILKPTNSPSDRVVWIPIDGIFRMSGHVLRGTGKVYTAQDNQEIPDEHKEVSAVMLKFKSPQAGFLLDQSINKQGNAATLAWPIAMVMSELFDKIGWMNRILAFVAYLVMIVASGSILAAVYNSIRERRRDFAILRSLGAHRSTVFSSVVLESSLLAALGSVAGYGVYLLILWAAGLIIRAQTGVVLDIFQFHPALLLAPLGMTAGGALAGLLPAWKAYETEVIEHLVPIS